MMTMKAFILESDGKAFGRRHVSTGLVTARQISRSDWWMPPKWGTEGNSNPSGVYILLHERQCYVGISDRAQGVVDRIKQHHSRRNELWWSRAIYFYSLLFEQEARLKEWLEARLYALLADAGMTMIGAAATENRMPPHGLQMLSDICELLGVLNIPIEVGEHDRQMPQLGTNGAEVSPRPDNPHAWAVAVSQALGRRKMFGGLDDRIRTGEFGDVWRRRFASLQMLDSEGRLLSEDERPWPIPAPPHTAQ